MRASAGDEEEAERNVDETDARAPTVSGIFWQEYQSAGTASKSAKRAQRMERRKERKGERKRERGKRSECKKDTVNGAWTLRLRDHRLTLSFIMFIPQTGIVPTYDVRFFLSASLATKS